MKILHLSDLHITADDQANVPVQQRIDFIRTHYPESYVVITGDIIDNEGAVVPGTPLPIPGGDPPAVLPTALQNPPPPLGPIAPHLQRTELALGKALAMLSTLPRFVFLTPGNHDYGLWGNLYADEYLKAFDERLFVPLANRPISGAPIFKVVLSPDVSIRPYSAQYPITYLISEGGVSVELLGLNTVPAPTFLGDLTILATGAIGGNQLSAVDKYTFARRLINSPIDPLGINRICFFHHHPWIHTDLLMNLRDADQLLPLIRNVEDLILFGHRHSEKRFMPADVPGAGFRFGAIAGGMSRVDSGAWQIEVTSPSAWSLTRVPIL